MTLKWLHKSWVYFWNSIGILIATSIILLSLLYVLIQLPFSKVYIADRIENSFNANRQAVLEIGDLSGHVPFSFSLSNINLYSDSTKSLILISVDSTKASIDLRGWFSNQLIFPSLEIFEPRIYFDVEEGLSTFFKANMAPNVSSDTLKNPKNRNEIGLLFPSVKAHNGTIIIDNISIDDSVFINTQILTLSSLSLETYFEYSDDQRFLDIEHLSFSVPETKIERINIFGQIFNDDRFLEFNAFNVNTLQNALRFSAEFDGINMLKPNLNQQFDESYFSISIDELITYPKNLKKLVLDFPDIEEQIYARIDVEGKTDSITVNSAYLLVGNTEMEGYGAFKPARGYESEFINLDIERLQLDSVNLKAWIPSLNKLQREVISQTQIKGKILGNSKSILSTMELSGDRGSISARTRIERTDSLQLDLKWNLENLNLGGLLQSNIETTDLNGILELSTNSLDPNIAKGNFGLQLSDGAINAFDFDSLNMSSIWNAGKIEPNYLLTSGTGYLDGSGLIALNDTTNYMELSGTAIQLDLKALANADVLSNSLVDLNYNFRISGSDIDNTFGLLTIELPNTVIEGDTLKNHQIYADFNSSFGNEKSFRLTSTPIDISINGDFQPNQVLDLAKFWVRNISNKIRSEVLFDESTFLEWSIKDSLKASIQLDVNLKDLDLIRAYLPAIPALRSQLTASSNFNVSSESILFNASFVDSSFSYKTFEADSLSLQLTGSFRKNESLKSFSSLQVLSNAASFKSDYLDAGELEFSFQLNDDSIFVQNSISAIAGDNDLFVQGFALLSDSTFKMTVDSLTMGNSNYKWQSIGKPALAYSNNERLEFQDFEFQNEQESLNFEGVFSDQPSDSVNYIIRNVDLARISDLINGRIGFSGILDADFTTKSLTRIPTIQGGLGIEAFSIDDRVIGDVEVSSLFNSDLKRFDTKVTVSTDSVKYPEYFTRTDRRGQNVTLEGYVLAPEEGEFVNEDSLFYFDLNFESIDLWVLPFIAPRVFTEMSGIASGGGSVWGNLEDFDFSLNYDIGMEDAIFFRPRYLDTFYFGLGNITFNREDGLIFNDLFIIDPSGGSAILNGTYDLGDLGKIHEMDITLEMNEFHFLNNTFDPDLAFFGDAYGSSIIRMTGTNLNPVLTTETPIIISDYSRIGIPLLEETEFDEDNKFIRFVDSFDFQSRAGTNSKATSTSQNADEEVNPFDRTFVERFTLDLQLVAQNPMEVQLIFDPVTGDQIEAEGTGRLGIRLEDEQLSMFGQFDINGGTYQFVSGEIFTRRFNLEPNGTIIWEGEPGNARLDLNAIYEARPDINTLTQTRSNLDSETSQRVPVELVLNVGGSITAIENNFYFRLPNNFETRQNSTLNTQIATLNRNEDEKLIQAASFLLMGDFIPSSTASSDATNTLATNFSGSSAVLNPLLSSQVISPLLSNQINSLLRSDIGSLDIDFNLNTYNNVDLGVALRLYNDRIILSREGQITGAQSNIGDIGATYRINNTLSVSAFHRQDRTFSNITGGEDTQQAQDINGVGFEAEVSFNSWQEFFRRLTSPFRKLFGKKKDNTEIATSE